MKHCILLFTLGLFVTCSQSQIEVDIYHKPRYSDELLQSIGTPNQTYDEVGLFKFMNGEYYGLIKVGKPAKEFKVIFDTTWGDSWLYSGHCAFYEMACMLHTHYDSSKSSTYKENGVKFNRTDSDLSLRGFLSVDDFHLPHLKVENQTFVEVTHASMNPFFFEKADGLIGLAFSSLATDGTLPFFYNMVKQKLVKENIFTFYMNRDPTTNKAGTLILGGTDRSHIKTNLTYLPVREQEYWKIRMDKVLLKDGNKTSSYCNTGCYAMMDTSANSIVGPSDIIENINNKLGARSIVNFWPYKYMVDCRTFAKLPHITFVLAGQNFTIESKYYVQKMTTFGFTICLSPFIPSTTSDIWQLGGAFLMQYYTEFDLDEGRIGIAETIV